MKKTLLYKSPYFLIYQISKKRHLDLEMIMNGSIINTRQLPHTMYFIEKHCPSVLTTECFNDLDLPFKVELKETEIAHLLEHIVLDELCSLKLDQGAQQASYSGTTSWNWVKEKRGIFHIMFNVPEEESLFFEAFKKGAHMIEELFQVHTDERAASYLPAPAL